MSKLLAVIVSAVSFGLSIMYFINQDFAPAVAWLVCGAIWALNVVYGK